MGLADLYEGIEDAPVIARPREAQPSPQEYDCGCIALYWVDGQWNREMRLAHACGTAECEVEAEPPKETRQ